MDGRSWASVVAPAMHAQVPDSVRAFDAASKGCAGHDSASRSPNALFSSFGAELQGMLEMALRPLRMLEDSLCLWLARATILLERAEVFHGGQGLSPASQGPCSSDTVVDGPLPTVQAPLVDADGYLGVVGNIDCVRLMLSELVEPVEPCASEPEGHHKMVSIGKVAAGFNHAAAGSDDVWDVGRGCTLATG